MTKSRGGGSGVADHDMCNWALQQMQTGRSQWWAGLDTETALQTPGVQILVLSCWGSALFRAEEVGGCREASQ